MRSLVNYRKRWVVLYFYPKNNTSGCTHEACQFRDDTLELDKLGADVLGISIDNRKSHAEFSRKYGLPFPLLADTDGKVATSYGSFFSFGPIRFARRHTFIVDPQGQIAKIYRNVDPKTHANQVVRDLSNLKSAKH
jgi:peroxiredoxin Q/BCP